MLYCLRNKSVTLIELLIAITLLSVIVLAINNVNVFSRYHVVSADRRAKIQNDASRCLEHMTKQISRAIGNAQIDGASNIINNTLRIQGDQAILAYIDDNPPDGKRDIVNDHWIGYRFTGVNGGPDNRNQIWYYSNCGTDMNCVRSGRPAQEVIARDISSFSTSALVDNYVTVDITACWDPTGTCNTPDNPSVTMSTSINLPSVSSN